jgi:PIN domain nuclease of toxin-antitoxin system
MVDTQSFLWSAISPEKLSRTAAEAIADDANELIVSAVIWWELSIKWELGKMSGYFDNPDEFIDRHARQLEAQELPITSRHTLQTARLPRIHRDPFDRVLIAQAQVEGLPLITSDHTIARYPVEILW